MFRAERLQKIFLRGWFCVAASERIAVETVVARLFVDVVGVSQVRGEKGHFTVVTENRIGLLEVAIDPNPLIKDKAFALEMIAPRFLEIF